MAENLIELKYTYNRNRLPKLTTLGALLSGDKEAHVFRISIVDDAGDVDLTGASVSGWFIRDDRNEPDDATVPLTGRIEEDNIAVLPLSDGCYSVVGPFSLVIRVMLGESDATVFWARGRVVRSRTDNVPDTSAGRGLDELLAEIAAYAADVERMHEDVMGAASGSGNMPSGGTAGQILAKKTDKSFDAHWIDAPQGGSGSGNGTVTGVKIGDASYTPNASGVVDLSGMTAPNAASLNGKDAKYYIQPENLLDNSYWGLPNQIVNQNGFSSGGILTKWAEFISRWKEYAGQTGSTFTFDDSGALLNGTVGQNIPAKSVSSGKPYTYAVYFMDDTVLCVSGTVETGVAGWTVFAELVVEGIHLRIFSDNVNTIGVTFGDAGTKRIKGHALLPGIYTSANVPPYAPKGYAAELMACEMYDNATNSYIGYLARIEAAYAQGVNEA